MKFLPGFILILVAITFGYNEYSASAKYEQYNSFLNQLSTSKVTSFEAANAAKIKLQINCETTKLQLEKNGSSLDECQTYISSFHDECKDKVFRLAPLEFSGTEEFEKYAKRYQRCVLPLDIASMETNFL
ncbi:hypothetical protein [Pseudoalteromonas ulvae]|uniref:Uncharacterized protein n=1 Tax=Pseudoalteromonas ulvae TaxID=107327 RepID=A0A244CMF0_PSEDV|nr:hypothetical protein [Pseudoalteromonas ulvae]OUL56807.1 hypothetical protein B1199_15660 [Pseudoalteromonas ulvae]